MSFNKKYKEYRKKKAEKDRYSHRLSVSFNKEQYDLIMREKEKTGATIGQVVRSRIFEATNNQGWIDDASQQLDEQEEFVVKISDEDKQLLEGANYALGRIGNNLNQIARQANKHNFLDSTEIQSLENAIQEVYDDLEEIKSCL